MAQTLTSEPLATGRNSADSLLPALRAIPRHCYERSTAKGLALVARGVALYAVSVALLFFVQIWWLVPALWALAGLALAGLFVLGHDCAHGALFDSKRMNRTIGRVLMVPTLHVYESWVLGHNRIHHGHTLRQGMDFVWHPKTVEEYQAMSRLQKLRHRIEWSAIGAGFYYGREVWWNKMITFESPERYRVQIRKDKRFLTIWVALGFLATIALGFVTGGALGAVWLPIKLLVVPFFAFIWLIGFTVYVHHIATDIKWWPRRKWTSFAGQVEGTTVLRIPRLANMYLNNIFVHVPHHVDVRIPCHALPEAAAAIKAEFPDAVHYDRLRLRDYVATTRACKLYDFDEQRWLPYP